MTEKQEEYVAESGDSTATLAAALDAAISRGATKAKAIWGRNSAKYLFALMDKPVTVRLCDGSAIAGTLVGVSTYELFIRQAGGLEVMVFKNAIKFLHPSLSDTDDYPVFTAQTTQEVCFEQAKADYQRAKADGADQVELERLAAMVVEAHESLGGIGG